MRTFEICLAVIASFVIGVDVGSSLIPVNPPEHLAIHFNAGTQECNPAHFQEAQTSTIEVCATYNDPEVVFGPCEFCNGWQPPATCDLPTLRFDTACVRGEELDAMSQWLALMNVTDPCAKFIKAGVPCVMNGPVDCNVGCTSLSEPGGIIDHLIPTGDPRTMHYDGTGLFCDENGWCAP